MKRGKLALQVLILFVACVAVYALVFKWIEHRRVAKGPWVVRFATESNQPAIQITQANLKIENVRIIFTGATVTNSNIQTVTFSEPRNVPFDLPFGQCVFQDVLFQPGAVAMKMFGHEIQLMPRVLTIDSKEREWRSGETIELPAK